MIKLDSKDIQILSVLQRNGRITKTALSEQIFLSPTPCWERIKRLEKADIIVGYGAQISIANMGNYATIFMEVKIASHQARDFNLFENAVQDMDEDTTKSATFESNTGSRSIADGDELAVINIVTSGMSGTTATLDTDLSRELGGYTIDSANNNYVVFGVGSNSSMIGKTIHEAPVHFAQTGTMSAEKKYNRLVAVFEVPKTYMASMGDMRRPKFIGTLMPMMRLEGKSGALDSHYSSIDQ